MFPQVLLYLKQVSRIFCNLQYLITGIVVDVVYAKLHRGV
jgi:hypothetical protein